MLRAILVAAAVLCVVSRLKLAAAGHPPKPKQATCDLGKQTQATALDTYGTIQIVCPATSNLQATGAPGSQVHYLASDGPDIQGGTLPAGATFDVGNAYKAHVLNVPQLPPKPHSVYFLCQVDEKQRCFIRVDVPQSPPLGPNACVVAGSEVNFTAAGDGSVVQFSCGASGTLRPADANKVYDSTCKKELDLATVVEGAKSQKSGDGTAVTFPHRPKATQKVCYVCDQKNGGGQCNVMIEIAGVGGSAVGLTARSASALGVVVVAAALLRVL